jgi:hypothetical protein
MRMTKKTAINPLLRGFWYALIIGIFGLFGISLFNSIIETKVETTKDSYYSFNPNIALDLIKQNNLEEAFILQPEDFEPDFDAHTSVVRWKQSDFLQIARSLYETATGDSLDNWVLQAVYFGTDCKTIESGFQQANLYFYKTMNSSLTKTRYTTSISINIPAGFIRIKNETISPIWGEKKSIDLQDIYISVDDALRLAEDNGGQELRKKIENRCEVSVSLAPDIEINNWKVVYFNNDSNLLIFTIDKASGEVNPK